MARHIKARKGSLKAFNESSYEDELFCLSKCQPRPPIAFPIMQQLRPEYDRRRKVVNHG